MFAHMSGGARGNAPSGHDADSFLLDPSPSPVCGGGPDANCVKNDDSGGKKESAEEKKIKRSLL